MMICPDCKDERTISQPVPPYGLLLCPRHRALRADQGTLWVTRGMGASIADLLDASGKGSANPDERDVRTELLLTGNPLTKRDLGRIGDAIQWAHAAANPPAWPVRGEE